jgi:nucleotide-binding universal stress UspA family protein
MSKLRRILVGYNFLPEGDIAARSASVLAARSGATLYLLHVVEPPPAYTYKLLLPTRMTSEEIARKLAAPLKQLAESPEFSRVPVVTDIQIGKPFVELIRVCRRWHADVIVVGVSPPGEERFLGSTAERILRKAPVPVFIAKQELRDGPKTILVPTDFSSCAKQTAEEALALVRGFGGRIVFLHVLEPPAVYPSAYGALPVFSSPLSADELEPDWQEFLHELPLGGGLHWEKQTREGQAAQTIAAVAKEVGADLVVMGTHGRSGVAHMLLGSVAEKVTHLTTCSVMTVRPSAYRFELP